MDFGEPVRQLGICAATGFYDSFRERRYEVKMVPFRWTLTTAVASIFLSVAFGKAGGQTAKDQPTLTTAELARAIARTIDAHTLRSPPGSPLEFKSATSVGNVVEMKYLG
jgi:hypothetical protein